MRFVRRCQFIVRPEVLIQVLLPVENRLDGRDPDLNLGIVRFTGRKSLQGKPGLAEQVYKKVVITACQPDKFKGNPRNNGNKQQTDQDPQTQAV